MDYTEVSDMAKEILPTDETTIQTKPDVEETANRYVLPISAFTAIHRAKQMQKRWTNQGECRVYVVEMPSEEVRYKVLLGNFRRADNAPHFAALKLLIINCSLLISNSHYASLLPRPLGRGLMKKEKNGL